MHPQHSRGTHRTEPVEPRTLRGVCGLFVTGVTVITSGRESQAGGTTVNSFASVSLEPPLVLFCLHKNSRLRAVVEDCGGYVVNFLAGPHEWLARSFAGKTTAALQHVATRLSGNGIPVLSDALAYLSCRVTNAFDGGDHTIFLGRVEELGVSSENREPLIFFRGALGALEEETQDQHPIFDG